MRRLGRLGLGARTRRSNFARDPELVHYRVIRGLAYWSPSASMKRAGARAEALGPDGDAARRRAIELNAQHRRNPQAANDDA